MRPAGRVWAPLILLAASMVAVASSASASCAPAAHPGGEWRSYGHDLANSRTQDLERTIGPLRAAQLKARWVVSSSTLGGSGQFNGTTVVADGCAFVASSDGWVFALNADTGALVWKTQLSSSPFFLAPGITGSVAVVGGRVYAVVDKVGSPYVVALDEGTGGLAWSSVVDSSPSSFVAASPAVWNGVVFAGFSGDEYDHTSKPAGEDIGLGPGSTGRGGYAIFDASTGAPLAHAFTIPDADYAFGYRGASIWGSAAVDAGTGYAYVGTGNPGGHARGSQVRLDHPHADAILKIDLDRTRSTFGQIVAAYKGTREQYVTGLDHQPACTKAGNLEYGSSGPAWSLGCVQFDVDFGASPNLFNDPSGRPLVGALQKAGVYHAVMRSTMSRAWTAIMGVPCFACNGSSTATDGRAIYADASPPSQMVSVTTGGADRWVSPVGDLIHYESVSTADGVVYTIDGNGTLDGFDAATGLPILRHPLTLDTHQDESGNVASSGVAIARDTVYVLVSDFVIAYQ